MTLVPALCLLVASAAWAGSGATKGSAVFRWVDEKGEVHYGDHLPMSGVDSDGKVRSTDAKTPSAAPPATPAAAPAPAPAAKAAPATKDPKDAKVPADPKAPADRAKQ
jgi:hypothetical protein